MEVILKDGSTKQIDHETTALKLAESLSRSLAKAALAARINGQMRDLSTVLQDRDLVEIITFDSDEGKHVLRHSASHIMAQAVKHLFPEAKLAIGPAIENGFYYDIDMEHRLTPEDFIAIENEMAKIVKEDFPFARKVVSKQEALDIFKRQGEIYKVELVENLPEDAVISLYTQGDFMDLCAGPHVPSTCRVKAVKLQSLAGAYWRGDEKNKMLQRIYGTAFEKKNDLDAYLTMLEEAAKRDHRKLGRELDLFSMHDEGPGFPFFHPKGMILRNELEGYWKALHKEYGYEEIKTPIILRQELWQQSGHWDHYRDNMYFTTIDEEGYAIKPMNCPGGILVYRSNHHSYRDLPMRLAELGLVHRHEMSGALHGLMRVRSFTQDDAHIYMLPEQIQQEIEGVIELIDRVYKVFGFSYFVELSTRPEDSMGSDETWERTTAALRKALESRGLEYRVNEGDGAFYGPKIDFHLRDSIGRTWQCGTIQLDMLMPENFDLTYVGEDGQKHRPVMIHRTAFGSIERFIGILIEHFAGAFPVWLAPVQARLLPLTDRQADYAHDLAGQWKKLGLRVEVDDRSEKIGYKIREGQLQKIPYLLVVGDKELQSSTVAVRKRGQGELGTMETKSFVARLQKEIEDKLID